MVDSKVIICDGVTLSRDNWPILYIILVDDLDQHLIYGRTNLTEKMASVEEVNQK